MAWIDVIPPRRSDGSLHEEYERISDADGDVDAVLQIHSLNPLSLRHHYDLYVTAMRRSSPLSRARREMIGVVVSAINECHY